MRSTALIKLLSVVPYKFAQRWTFYKTHPTKTLANPMSPFTNAQAMRVYDWLLFCIFVGKKEFTKPRAVTDVIFSDICHRVRSFYARY